MDTLINLIEASVLNPTTDTGQAFLVCVFALWLGSTFNVNRSRTKRRNEEVK